MKIVERNMTDAPLISLLHRAAQRASATYSGMQRSAERETTVSQQLVLSALLKLGSASQTELVNASGVDRSTMTDIVNRLRSAGLVERRRVREDARRYIIKLTESGRDAARAGRACADATERVMLNALPPAQRRAFLCALASLVHTQQAAE